MVIYLVPEILGSNPLWSKIFPLSNSPCGPISFLGFQIDQSGEVTWGHFYSTSTNHYLNHYIVLTGLYNS